MVFIRPLWYNNLLEDNFKAFTFGSFQIHRTFFKFLNELVVFEVSKQYFRSSNLLDNF